MSSKKSGRTPKFGFPCIIPKCGGTAAEMPPPRPDDAAIGDAVCATKKTGKNRNREHSVSSSRERSSSATLSDIATTPKRGPSVPTKASSNLAAGQQQPPAYECTVCSLLCTSEAQLKKHVVCAIIILMVI
jgi:hypothetical protein